MCLLWFLDLFALLWIIRGIGNNRCNRVITNIRFIGDIAAIRVFRVIRDTRGITHIKLRSVISDIRSIRVIRDIRSIMHVMVLRNTRLETLAGVISSIRHI